jgi:hypothetical protein
MQTDTVLRALMKNTENRITLDEKKNNYREKP